MVDLSLKHFGFPAMGTYCELQLYDDSRINARNLARKLGTEVQRLEQKYSPYRRDSVTTAINHSAGNKLGARIDRETRGLFEHALKCYEQSEGLMDITAGSLSRAWDFRNRTVPEQRRIDELRENVGYHKLSWRDSRLLLPQGMEIDFGGLIKAYAADSAARLARELGIRHGLINLGGDFVVIGPRPDGSPWTVGIANPTQPRALMARVDLEEGGLASSGDYERYFEHQGKRYSHIINPRTGWPGSGLRAVSVIADQCMKAGSMAKIAMLKDEDQAIVWLSDTGLPHAYMRNDGSIAGPAIKEETEKEATEAESTVQGESLSL